MTTDALFAKLETWQGDTPWGRVLDAGTGRHSLDWLATTGATEVVGVTADPRRRADLEETGRGNQHLVVGNWLDPAFLAGERFDVVLADYLLGAVDGWAPYFQDQLFDRLRRHTRARLYGVGLEPYAPANGDLEGELVWEIARLRDACILHAGHRCYREYPLDWVLRTLERCGYTVQDAALVPILYRERFVNGQLDVCLRKLPFMAPPLREPMRRHIEALRQRALAHIERNGPIPFGSDWVVWAQAQGAEATLPG